ncbi:hypothetical protein ACOMHN_003941 [Nucella lapillus]
MAELLQFSVVAVVVIVVLLQAISSSPAVSRTALRFKSEPSAMVGQDCIDQTDCDPYGVDMCTRSTADHRWAKACCREYCNYCNKTLPKKPQNCDAAAAKSRAATQAASRAGGKTAATRAGTTKPHPANAGRSKPPSKAGSKAPTRQGATRASQRKPTGGEPVLAVVGADGKIVVDGAAAEGEEKEQDEYDDDEYYDEDEEYDEDGEYDDDGEEGDEEGGREYFEEPEEEEEEFDYSTFQYRPHGYKQRDPDEPRALIDTGPEGCSCFPSRSNRNIPSMLYDNIDCKHEKLQGYAHLGIYRFDDNWDSSHESTLRPKLAHRLMPNKNFVWGYPKFVFVEADEPDKGPAPADDGDDEYGDEEADDDGEYDEEEYEGEYEEDEEEEEEEEESEDKPAREGYYDEDGEYHYFADDESLPSRMYDSEGELISRPQSLQSVKPPPSTAPKPSSALEAILPQIGFSPQTSLAGSRVPTAQATPLRTPSLPPITPASQGSQGSLVSQQASRERTSVRFKPRTLHRTFQGKYYDPMTKELYEFEITPDFGRRIDRWHVKKKKLDLGGRRGLSRGSVGAGVGGGGEAPATERGTPASGGGGSRAPSRYSQPNQSSRLLEKRTVTRW